jgi:hypothetical protein
MLPRPCRTVSHFQASNTFCVNASTSLGHSPSQLRAIRCKSMLVVNAVRGGLHPRSAQLNAGPRSSLDGDVRVPGIYGKRPAFELAIFCAILSRIERTYVCLSDGIAPMQQTPHRGHQETPWSILHRTRNCAAFPPNSARMAYLLPSRETAQNV